MAEKAAASGVGRAAPQTGAVHRGPRAGRMPRFNVAIQNRTERELPTARLIAALAVATAVAGPVAGCGGDDQNFIDGYNEATQPLRTLDPAVGKSLRSASEDSDDQVAANFGTLAEETANVNEELAELDAPDDVKRDFDGLKAALKRYAADLGAVAKGVKTGDVKQTRAGVTALGGDAEAVAAAEKAVKRKLED